MEELRREYEMFDEVFEDLGDISGSVALDIGCGGGSLVSYLVRKKGLEIVFAIDFFTGTLGLLKEKLSSDEMLKVNYIKADLRRVDFLKDCFFDLVTAYWTLSVVEKFTPGGTENVLSEVCRILKPQGQFVVVEHWPTDSTSSLDEPQKVWARWLNMFFKLDKALGEPPGIEYTPQSLIEIIENSGFKINHWKEMRATYLEQYSGFDPSLIEKVQKVTDKKLRDKLLLEIEQIDKSGKKYGMRNIPDYAVYATRPMHPKQRKVKTPTLAELYDTVYHKDSLGY